MQLLAGVRVLARVKDNEVVKRHGLNHTEIADCGLRIADCGLDEITQILACADQAAGRSLAGPLEQCRHGSPDTGPQLWDPAQAAPIDRRGQTPSLTHRDLTPLFDRRPKRRGPVSGAATGPPRERPAAKRRVRNLQSSTLHAS